MKTLFVIDSTTKQLKKSKSTLSPKDQNFQDNITNTKPQFLYVFAFLSTAVLLEETQYNIQDYSTYNLHLKIVRTNTGSIQNS